MTLLSVLIWIVWFRPVALGGRAGYIVVSGRSMEPAMRPGDLVILRRSHEYRVGDVVTYRIPSGGLRGGRIIHRIVGGDAAGGFLMRGDNKPDTDLWHPKPSDIEGRQWVRLPGGGRVVAFVRSPGIIAAAAGGIVFAVVFTRNPRRSDDLPDDVTDEVH